MDAATREQLMDELATIEAELEELDDEEQALLDAMDHDEEDYEELSEIRFARWRAECRRAEVLSEFPEVRYWPQEVIDG